MSWSASCKFTPSSWWTCPVRPAVTMLTWPSPARSPMRTELIRVCPASDPQDVDAISSSCPPATRQTRSSASSRLAAAEEPAGDDLRPAVSVEVADVHPITVRVLPALPPLHRRRAQDSLANSKTCNSARLSASSSPTRPSATSSSQPSPLRSAILNVRIEEDSFPPRSCCRAGKCRTHSGRRGTGWRGCSRPLFEKPATANRGGRPSATADGADAENRVSGKSRPISRWICGSSPLYRAALRRDSLSRGPLHPPSGAMPLRVPQKLSTRQRPTGVRVDRRSRGPADMHVEPATLRTPPRPASAGPIRTDSCTDLLRRILDRARLFHGPQDPAHSGTERAPGQPPARP